MHTICAQPSSFSIGTAHIGQHLIRSLSNINNESLRPKAAKRPNATTQAAGLFRDDNGVVWYRVGEGDTLSEIADHYLGRMSRAEMIVNLNRERLPDPNNLKIGQVLRMPNDASPVRLTETDREIR